MWVVNVFKEFTLSDWMKLFAGMQATYSAVMISSIFIYSFFFWRKQDYKRIYITAFTFSHLCLIFCTTITLYNGLYTWGDIWYWIMAVGYIVSDFILMKLWMKIITLSKQN